jgi:hypothetical protein
LDAEAEEEAAEKEAPETEQSRLQNQMGNQAVQQIVATQGSGDGGGGAGGVEIEMARRRAAAERQAQDFGGDPEPADGGPLTELDLTRSWNPGTPQSADRPKFLEAMPEDELPPEDASFLELVARAPTRFVRSSAVNDALLQPSPGILAISLRGWNRGVSRFVGSSLDRRAHAALLTTSAPLLQDPHGRVLLSRARNASLASSALARSPVLGAAPEATLCAYVNFALELESRDFRVRGARLALGDAEELPTATGLLTTLLAGSPAGTVRLTRLADPALSDLAVVLQTVLSLSDPSGIIPQLTEAAPEEEEEDPLGLESVLQAMTGGAKVPSDALFKTAIQGAERLASATTLTRVRFAGSALAIADVSQLWSAGAPSESLLGVMREVDKDTAACLQLLLDIARAAQRRTVAPRGLAVGLRRAAVALTRARERGVALLSEVIGGVLPGEPRWREVPPAQPDPLAEAWSDGDPAAAIPWLRSLPPSLERDAAITLTRVVIETDAEAMCGPLRDLRDAALVHQDPGLASALGVCLGATLLAAGGVDEALALANEQLAHGRNRRSGVVVAEGALLGIEALLARGDQPAANHLRVTTGAFLWNIGARGGLSLLARWLAPDAEPEHAPHHEDAPPSSLTTEVLGD